ncbi:MAG: protein kinase [Candidatus Hydrogenedens sp.]|jgi:serine/threonine protein kinase/ATP-dependent 26S proteasome regulatory subunit|nr:protein kinase [Candidatus Hydrogenedens sp.]
MPSGGPYKTGQRFGPYVLEAYLGSGAFKSVYRARNRGGTLPDAIVALGFPHRQDPEGLAELDKEFQMTRRLIHPNIMQVFALEQHEGISFLVMEYLEGTSLRSRLREQKSLALPEAVRHVGLISEALAYAHTAHVFHRDVKPENIFITSDNTPKLLDFGVARMLARISDKASTRIGTVAYMAPEALQGASGTNADLWALGVILYELVTGSPPFTGEVGEIIQKIMAARYDEEPLREKQVDNRMVRVLRKMLNKDPERRYQTADELSRDLEVVARRTRMADDDESRLEILIRASFPIVCVLSFEEDRVMASVRDIARRLSEDRGRPRRLYLWSASRGLRDEEDKLVRPDSMEDPTRALVHVIENPEDAIYLFLDLHHHFTPVTTRLVRDAARAVRMTRKSVLFLSPFYKVPEELEKQVALAVFQLPDRQHLDPLIERLAEECAQAGLSVDKNEETRTALLRATAGMTLNEAERAIRAAVLRHGGLGIEAVRMVVEEKTQVIRKSGILEYYHTSESFKDVGGLTRLLEWFRGRMPVFAGVARYAGLPQPRGVLLVGVPGCGKSLTARALAGAWSVPLLRLDVGRIFGPIVGASEANLRRAIQTAEAVSPCILWIDEVEKGFAGVRGQGGGGVAARVFGHFLTWLQDKRSPVFVVATANDLSAIPPEFLRQGRFDDIFFVGLPTKPEREAILRIHLAKRGRDPENFDLQALVEASEGYSGAEIEQAVISGLFRAFEADRELETTDMLIALKEAPPLSRSRQAEIRALTDWAQRHARHAQ